MVRVLSSFWPIDHEPDFFQLAIGLFETTSQKDLLPSDACGVSLATSSCPGAMFPSFGGQRTHYIHKVACASGKPVPSHVIRGSFLTLIATEVFGTESWISSVSSIC